MNKNKSRRKKREYPDISFQNKGKKTQSKKKYVFTQVFWDAESIALIRFEFGANN